MDETYESIEVKDEELNQMIDLYNENRENQKGEQDNLLNDIKDKITTCLCDSNKTKTRNINYSEVPFKRILKKDENNELWVPIKNKTRLRILRIFVKRQAKVSRVNFKCKKQLSACMMCKSKVKVGLNIFHNNPTCSENNLLCYSCMTNYIHHKNEKCPLCYTDFDFNERPCIIKYKREKINDKS